MPLQVVNNAQLMCSFGTSAASLVIMPVNRTICDQQPEATIQDFVPLMNILPFGMCSSPSNPQVAAATAAAMGVLTPQPCIPATVSPWTPGDPTVLVNNIPALNDSSTCNCLWTGAITITDAGEQTVNLAAA